MKLALVPAAALLLLASSVSLSLADTVPAPPCARWWGEVWARMPGYDHVVFIDNACSVPLDCVIRTDVAPEPLRAVVAPGARVDRTTFRGSPSSVFTPLVRCTVPAPRRPPPRAE